MISLRVLTLIAQNCRIVPSDPNWPSYVTCPHNSSRLLESIVEELVNVMIQGQTGVVVPDNMNIGPENLEYEEQNYIINETGEGSMPVWQPSYFPGNRRTN